MSADKRVGVVASVDTGMVVGGAKRQGRLHLHAKLWGVLLCVALILGSAGSVLYVHRHQGDTRANTNRTQAGGTPAPDTSNYTPDQKAQSYLGKQNYAAAIGVYQQQLKSAATGADKAQIYANLSTTELNTKNYAQAYQYAVQADALAPTEQTASLAAYAAQRNGDNKNAAKYYQLAINRLDPNDPGYDYALNDLQSSLKEVSG